jgi:competence protein ComEC
LPDRPGRGVLAGVGAWAIGSGVGHMVPVLPGSVWIVPAVLAALTATAAVRPLLWLAALAGFVWTVTLAHQRLADRLPADRAGVDIALCGWIDDFPKSAPGQVSFSFRVDAAADQPDLPGRLRLVWYRPPVELKAGQALQLVVRLRQIRGLANPGGFDFERWALVEGYGATGYVRAGRDLDVPMRLDRWWLGVRAELARRLQRPGTSDQARAVLAALVLGERSGFADDAWASLARTGTSHLFAISGLHVGLIAAIFFAAARRLALRLPSAVAVYDLEIASAVALAAAALYAALAGFTLPTQRALIMLAAGLLMVIRRDPRRTVQALGLALILISLLDPFCMLRASFWMSFGAVAVIVLAISERSAAQCSEGGRLKIWNLVRIQLAISLGLLPAGALLFGQVSFAGPIVNLLAVPFFACIMVPLALAYALMAVLPVAGILDLPLECIAFLAEASWSMLGWIGGLPWAAAAIAIPAGWAAVLATLGALLCLPGVPPLPGRGLALLLMGSLAQGYGNRVAAGDARATVLDVGHGLAVLVQTRRHVLLYDAGPSYQSGYDSGRRVVIPAAAALGIHRLDRMVISHADADHAGGIAAVRADFPEADLMAGPSVDLPGASACASGQHWVWDGVRFTVLHPERGLRQEDNNNGSCVLRIDTDGGSLLLPGDIESPAELELLQRGQLDPVDVVVMPHHGSATSSSEFFVRRLRPSFAIASAAVPSRWNFPRPEIRSRWEAAGAEIWVTGQVGAVSVQLHSGSPPQVYGERLQHRRYWSAAPRAVPGDPLRSGL